MAKRRTPPRLADLPGLFDIFGPDPQVSAPNTAQTLRDLGGGKNDNDAEELKLDTRAAIRPDRLRFISFGSGSSGNCAYIGTPDCGLLIDAGVDNHSIDTMLARNGIRPETIAGILITHDHGDHVKYAYTILRRNRHMRLYATNRVLGGLLRRHNISRRIQDYHTAVFKEIPFRVGPMEITAFEVSHDATDNVGYHISMGSTTFVVATDMGTVTERADHYMRLATSLMIESNYDETMLLNGPYPQYLKARILSPTGHHDNRATAAYLARIYNPRLRHIFLCHLSQDNNTPDTALDTVRRTLTHTGIQVVDASAPHTLLAQDATVMLTALPRSQASLMFTI